MDKAVQKKSVDHKYNLSQHQEVDELIQEELDRSLHRKYVINNEHKKLEKNETDLNSCLEIFVANTRLSKFQIIDQMVDKISIILEEKGVTVFDVNQLHPEPERWVPRVSSENETPPEFAQRVYGSFRGITRADIKYIDVKLYKALDNWETNKKPFPKDFSIFKKKDINAGRLPSDYHHYSYQIVNSNDKKQ